MFEWDILVFYVNREILKLYYLEVVVGIFDLKVKVCLRFFFYNFILNDLVVNMFLGCMIVVDWEFFEVFWFNIDCIFEESDCVFLDWDVNDCFIGLLLKLFVYGWWLFWVKYMYWVVFIYIEDLVMF